MEEAEGIGGKSVAKRLIGSECALGKPARVWKGNWPRDPRRERLREHLSEVCHDQMEEQLTQVYTLD